MLALPPKAGMCDARAMSALVHKQTCAAQKSMSALLIATRKRIPAKGHVYLTPESGHVRCNGVCLLRANSGHRQRHSNLYKKRAAALRGENDCGFLGQTFPLFLGCQLHERLVSRVRELERVIDRGHSRDFAI